MLTGSNLWLHKKRNQKKRSHGGIPCSAPDQRHPRPGSLCGYTCLLSRALECSGTSCLTHLQMTDNPSYTKVLSMVNSFFDFLGFLAPVTIRGRLLLRQLSSEVREWDTPLSENRHENWRKWHDSPQGLRDLQIPHACITIFF